jgi:hypothetical protein
MYHPRLVIRSVLRPVCAQALLGMADGGLDDGLTSAGQVLGRCLDDDSRQVSESLVRRMINSLVALASIIG